MAISETDPPPEVKVQLTGSSHYENMRDAVLLSLMVIHPNPNDEARAKLNDKDSETKSETTKPKGDNQCELTIFSYEEVTSVNVISYKKIREFSSHHRDAEAALTAWYRTAKRSDWQNLTEVKRVYPSADLVGRYIVFNIRGNKYRLIALIVYRSQTVFIVKVLTHEEYDLGKWKE
jgi:mRNA interferase HigB